MSTMGSHGLALLFPIVLGLLVTPVFADQVPQGGDFAARFLEAEESELQKVQSEVNLAEWNYETDINDENLQRSLAAAADASVIESKLANAARSLLKREDSQSYLSKAGHENMEHRRLQKLSQMNAGSPADARVRRRLQEIISEMSAIYSTSTDPKGRVLDPDLNEIMEQSRSEHELRTAWTQWRDAVGPRTRELFREYIKLSNVGAKDTGFKDKGDVWRSGYDMTGEAFEKMVSDSWDELKELYEDLHCFVRSKLIEFYGEEKAVDSHGRIYAHLLGNMWAQSWDTLYDILQPFPNRKTLSITKSLRRRGYSPAQMIKTAEKFYMSLGFSKLPSGFWDGSMFTKPKDRSVVCHPSAWDLDGGYDVRLKMCMKVNQEDFMTVHHELGHIYYYMTYRDLPAIFRDGANDGFHEAIGDTINLSSFTDSYLEHLRLAPRNAEVDDQAKYEEGINYLMSVALEKISFLPYGYLIDLWRWDAFSESVPFDKLNERYWQLRNDLQGVAAPVPRASNKDFDPVAKFHVAADVPYMRYFLASLYQFQFHDSMCRLSGFTGPLHECSVFDSKAAGSKFREMLSKGSSQPWQQTIAILTGNSTLSAQPILDYFTPLQAWLKEQNKGSACGWRTPLAQFSEKAVSAPVQPSSESSASLFSGVGYGMLFVGIVFAFATTKRRKGYRTISKRLQ